MPLFWVLCNVAELLSSSTLWGRRKAEVVLDHSVADSKSTFFLYVDVGSGYRWVLRSGGQRLADSEGAYANKAECERAIERAKEGYPEAVVRDLTR